MPASFRMARESALAAVQSFSPSSYAPLFVLLVVQLLYIVLGLNLGSTFGMAISGTVARMIAGPDASDYPAFLQLLPVTFSFVESVTFIVIGAWALPRVAAAILGGASGGRAAAAFAPTFLGLAAAFTLMYVWQRIMPHVVPPALSLFIHGGFEMATATWVVSVLVGYAITTLFVYVPVVAVAGSGPAMAALPTGFREGLGKFWITFPIAVAFSLPALVVQLIVQVNGGFLAARTRPENIAYFMIAYAVLGSIGTYLLWSMATRLHRTAEVTR